MSSLEAKSGVTIATCDATDEESLHQAIGNNHIGALVSCIGQRDSAVADEEIYRTLCNGTINLYRAAKACKASRFITIAGGIHKTAAGEVRCEMIRNAAREAGLATIAHSKSENDNGGPTVIVVDSTVFFKDSATIFDLIAKSAEKQGQASLTLVEGSWEVRCNPISGPDLADRMVSLLVEDIPFGGRVTAGGPEELTFAELVDAAGDALGVGAVAHKTIPQWWARIILAGAGLGSAFGSHKAMALQRFFSFLWVIGTDGSPNSLVGEPGGHDAVTDFYKDLAAKRGQSTISEPEKANLALDCEKFM